MIFAESALTELGQTSQLSGSDPWPYDFLINDLNGGFEEIDQFSLYMHKARAEYLLALSCQ